MNAITHGVHHIGLTVKSLASVKDFFIDVLGFREAGGRPDYPAVFITDGTVTITLWEVKKKTQHVPFDHRQNIGLHHLALMVAPEKLDVIMQKVAATPEVVIEFFPELLGDGPARHSIFYAPGGIRLELIAPGRKQ